MRAIRAVWDLSGPGVARGVSHITYADSDVDRQAGTHECTEAQEMPSLPHLKLSLPSSNSSKQIMKFSSCSRS